MELELYSDYGSPETDKSFFQFDNNNNFGKDFNNNQNNDKEMPAKKRIPKVRLLLFYFFLSFIQINFFFIRILSNMRKKYFKSRHKS
jgi:hypothetical protein